MIGLYHNEGNGLFVDEAPASAVGRPSLLTLSFAAFFFDFDLDGRLDIFAASGHVADDIGTVQPKVTYAQKPHLFRTLGGRRFEDVAPRSRARAPEGHGGARAPPIWTSTTTETWTSWSRPTTARLPAAKRRRQPQRRPSRETRGNAVEPRRHRARSR